MSCVVSESIPGNADNAETGVTFNQSVHATLQKPTALVLGSLWVHLPVSNALLRGSRLASPAWLLRDLPRDRRADGAGGQRATTRTPPTSPMAERSQDDSATTAMDSNSRHFHRVPRIIYCAGDLEFAFDAEPLASHMIDGSSILNRGFSS